MFVMLGYDHKNNFLKEDFGERKIYQWRKIEVKGKLDLEKN